MPNPSETQPVPFATDLLRAVPFALFMLWLTVFPLAGPLLGNDVSMDWFLWSHALGLLACTGRVVEHRSRQIFIVGTLLTTAVTLVYIPLAGQCDAVLLAVLGLTAAPLPIQTVLLLKTTSRPILLGAVGLGVGNIGELLLAQLPLSSFVKLAFISGMLLSAIFVPLHRKPRPSAHETVAQRYLPFIFLFQITYGLMYKFLYPVYYKVAWASGSELLVYVVVAVMAVHYRRCRREMMLACGIVFAMFAYVFLQIPVNTIAVNACMWSVMVSAGIIDMVILVYLLLFVDCPRQIAICFSTMLGGIATGALIVRWLGENANHMETTVFIALILSAITLIFGRSDEQSTENNKKSPTPGLPPAPLAMPTKESSQEMAETIRHPFSAQEWRVLQAVSRLQNYRAAAAALEITESSVKTYMQRIYKKTGTFHRQQLLDKVAATFGLPLSPHPPLSASPPATGGFPLKTGTDDRTGQLPESKPCLPPSAVDNNRRMTLRLSALRSALRR